MGLDRRIFELEKLFAQTSETIGPRPEMSAILNEFGALKQSYAHGLRGGVPIVPKRIPHKILGPDFTLADVVRLSVERASEAGAFPEDETPYWSATALELFGSRTDLATVVQWGQVHGV